MTLDSKNLPKLEEEIKRLQIQNQELKQKYLEKSVRRYSQLRASSRSQRHADPEVLSQRLKGGTAKALP